ncbi:hypothetical protein [Phreatobacter cathodiphilus]|uniref:hypothetical protein n=1 Tax=Phreatobacter cathodiphilus TaxID=1868589 RepID=UPI0011B1DADB|nr:hypothetical protein [Phreatobacter cathodiphilus]
MTRIEEKIGQSIREAAEVYVGMAGWWLSHAPESFLQMKIADGIHSLGYGVFVDATYQKIRREVGLLKGPKPQTALSRPDICVWSKDDRTLKAFIEVKKANHLAPVQADCTKIEGLMRPPYAPPYGYVIAYSEAKGMRAAETLKNRFKTWGQITGWKVIESGLCEAPDDEGYQWGHVVLKRYIRPRSVHD